MREKRVRGQDKPEPLFDYNLDACDGSEPFLVNYDEISAPALSSLGSVSKEEAEKTQKQAGLALSSDADYLSPMPISSADPLNPELFIGHHRRMEREERRMQVQERQKLVVTASKVRSQKEILSRTDWKSNIDKIVRIHDLSDPSEISQKRDLALEEMATFLTKFEEYNRRYNRRDSHAVAEAKPASITKSKTSTRPKPKKPKPAPAPEPEEILISIRPTAFGYMVPPRLFPPREFQLPQLLLAEVDAYDLVDSLERSRKTDAKN